MDILDELIERNGGLYRKMQSYKFAPEAIPALPGVYTLIHVPTRRRYIDGSRDVRAAYMQSRTSLRAGAFPHPELQALYDANPECIEFMVLEVVKDIEAMIRQRDWWTVALDAHTTGFNAPLALPNAA